MTISTRLNQFLSDQHIAYQTVNHSHSNSSLHSAVAASIPLMHLAKSVVLEDHQGHHLMAVLPANAKISFSALNDELNANYHMVKERQVYHMFEDCEHGAIPPIGNAYHMGMVYDQALADLDHVYIEAGDHQTLIKLDQEAFSKLMRHGRQMHFASQIFH